MDIIEALARLEKGEKVGRDFWHGEMHLEMHMNWITIVDARQFSLGTRRSWMPSQSEVRATDWEVVDGK